MQYEALMNDLQKLLEDLQEPDPSVRKRATAALWLRWHEEAGNEATSRLQEGIQLLNDNQLNDAEELFSLLASDFPDFPEAHNKLATVLFLNGNYTLSIEECEITLKLNPHHFGAWNGLGLCLYQTGRFQEAIKSFQKALEIQPYSRTNRVYIAKCRGKLN